MTSPSIEAPANLGVIRSAGDDLRGRELGELCEPRLGLAPMEVRFQDDRASGGQGTGRDRAHHLERGPTQLARGSEVGGAEDVGKGLFYVVLLDEG